jgi:hypothetical protein
MNTRFHTLALPCDAYQSQSHAPQFKTLHVPVIEGALIVQLIEGTKFSLPSETGGESLLALAYPSHRASQPSAARLRLSSSSGWARRRSAPESTRLAASSGMRSSLYSSRCGCCSSINRDSYTDDNQISYTYSLTQHPSDIPPHYRCCSRK